VPNDPASGTRRSGTGAPTAITGQVPAREPPDGTDSTPVANLGSTAALLLAATFTVAAAAKLRTRAATAAAFADLRVPAAPVAAVAVPVAELAVAAALVVAPRPGGVAATCLLVGFTAVLVRAARAGTPVRCACFGSTSADPGVAAALVRNGLLLGAALASLGASGPRAPRLDSLVAVTSAWSAGTVVVALLAFRHRVGPLLRIRLAGEAR
jgi:hypothetical protein